MTTSAVQLELQPRELMGKKVGRLRRAGIIPVHLYGPGIESRALQCAARQLIPILAAAGASSPISVSIEGEQGSHLAFAREIQWDPTRDTVLHVDLLAADVSRTVTAQVNIVFVGEAPGAVRTGGNISQLLFSIDVSALPLDMPAQAEVDLAVMTSDDSIIRAGDIPLPSEVSLLTDPEEMVARIDVPRGAIGVEAEEEEAKEEAEAEAEE
ncbi:MAG: 50S ribosomal protein L25 [Chloroflexi bacterium]|nr:50S ribosomal protein L25 [Chloroflexota bacterium]MYE40957.1 50S ribosomal protein L25 [Chloroflexota bacterium]